MSSHRKEYDPSNSRVKFQETKLTPNDRVFIQQSRSNLASALLGVGGGTFLTMYTVLRLRHPTSFYRAWSFLGGSLAAAGSGLYVARQEYIRAVVELGDDSYLRRFLFNSAVNYNPELNAQQLYSKLSLEYDERREKQYIDQNRPPHKPV